MASAAFCLECGRLAPGTFPPPRYPDAYTPRHLAEKILTSRAALEGERKQVTVLFADVKGSMELAEQLDPEEWHRVMDRFFQLLAEGVHRFEGTVIQFTGDGIMALFGAPIALGEERAEARRQAHHRLLADAITTHHGTPHDDLGDGIMASFAGAADAVAAAVAIQQAIEAASRRTDVAGVAVRIGISAGDVAREGAHPHGMPLVEAARLL